MDVISQVTVIEYELKKYISTREPSVKKEVKDVFLFPYNRTATFTP